MRPRARRAPFGPYEVRRGGDVTGEPMLLYRLQDGRFEPDRPVRPAY